MSTPGDIRFTISSPDEVYRTTTILTTQEEKTPALLEPDPETPVIDGKISDAGGSRVDEKSNLKGDRWNIVILLFFYMLQGIPLGLIGAIPLYLQNRGASYRQQGEFSLAKWPFSMKLLWAPVVDSCFSARFGRRKSWLVPAQYLIGAFMFFLSRNVDAWLGEEGTDATPNVAVLTFCFFCLNFLAATQDIAVDGWALTMLKRCNVGHVSTCNSVGQTAGVFIGYVVFIGLESAEFSNNFFRSVPQEQGLVTLSGFLYFWSLVYLVTTTLVAVFKTESYSTNPYEEDEKEGLNIVKSYKLLWEISKLRVIRVTAVVLLTTTIGFSACDALTNLKLIDAGVPKEKLVLISVPMFPLHMVLPFVISKYTTGPRPMGIYLKTTPFRLLCNLVAALLVWATPLMVHDGNVPLYYYGLLLAVNTLHQITMFIMFVAVMAFFARVSDPAVGGTYMTLLNTLTNLGSMWPTTLVLWLVDSLTFKTCSSPELDDNTCSSDEEAKSCVALGGSCSVWLDGYYVEIGLCFVIGLAWLVWARPTVNSLQDKDMKEWRVVKQ